MKAKLSYGGGVLSVSGSGIAGVEINYSGAFEYSIVASTMLNVRISNNKILILSQYRKIDIEGDIFTYRGELVVKRVVVGDWQANKIPHTISEIGFSTAHKLLSTPETMTINVEKMKSGNIVGRRVKKTKMALNKIIKPEAI